MPASVAQAERMRKFRRMIKSGIQPQNAARLLGVTPDTGRRWLAQLKADIALGPEPEYDDIVLEEALSPEAERALQDFGYFRARYFGRVTLPWQEEAAYAIVSYLETPEKEYVVSNAPPGGGKSTLYTHDIPAWLIAKKRSIRCLFGSRTEHMATMYVRRLRRALERVRPLRADEDDIRAGLAFDAVTTLTADFGRFRPLGTDLWRANEFLVATAEDDTADDKEATVAAYGMDQQFLGGRYDYVVWDDLIDKKCPVPSTPVWMADGTTKPAGELAVGDWVLGRSGVVTVTDVFDNGVVPVCRLTTRAGRSYVASNNHPVWTPDGWIRTEDADGYGVQPMSTHGQGHLPLAEAYLLGAMVGDGCLANGTCNFAQVDGPVKDAVEKIAIDLGWRVNRTPQRLAFAKGGRDYFRRMGIEGVNSWTKTVPDVVKRATPAAVAAFLSGYLDTDGSVDTRRSFGISFVTVSHQLAVDVLDLLTRCGISATIARRTGVANKEGRRGSWHIRISHNETALAARILAPVGPKRALLDQAHELRPRSFGVTDYVTSVEDLPPERTVGISTSDGTLVLGGILTHNTIKSVEAMETLIALYESEMECQPANATVSMANGTIRRVDELKIGDMVLGQTGPTPVTGIADNGEAEVFAVFTRAGRRLLVTGNHPLFTPAGWIEAKASIGYGVQARSTCGEESLPHHEARLLGYMVGDGGLTKNKTSIRCDFTNGDKGVLRDFRSIIKQMGWVATTKLGHGCVTLDLGCGTSGRGRHADPAGPRPFFRAHGIGGKGAHEKRVPESIMAGDERTVAEFLGAYFDTDGTVASGPGVGSFQARFDTTSIDLARDVHELLTRLGVEANLRFVGARPPNRSGWQVVVNTPGAGRFCQVVHSHSTGLRGKRLAAWREKCPPTRFPADFIEDRVTSMTSIGGMPTFAIETGDHTYVTGGILTHNTRVEPGGCLVLNGQRMKANDLYRYALNLKSGDDDDSPKYHHIKFRAHYEDRCQEDHGSDAKPYPQGCLLDPKRIPWKDQAALRKNKPGLYRVVYQQEDVDPDSLLIQPEWIDGLEGFPGCWDEQRRTGFLPRGIDPKTCISAAMVDPSPTKFWAILWILYHPPTDTRFLIDIERKKQGANDLLDYNPLERAFSGTMHEWQQRSRDMGAPITTWIVEANVAQRFILQYVWFRLWQVQMGVQVIPHQTSRNKSDEKLGVESIASIYRMGKMRLPKGGGNSAVHLMVSELIGYPGIAATNDTVMAHWFFEWNKHRLPLPYTKPPQFERPGYMRNMQRGMVG